MRICCCCRIRLEKAIRIPKVHQASQAALSQSVLFDGLCSLGTSVPFVLQSKPQTSLEDTRGVGLILRFGFFVLEGRQSSPKPQGSALQQAVQVFSLSQSCKQIIWLDSYLKDARLTKGAISGRMTNFVTIRELSRG